MEQNEFGNDILTLVDEEGVEHSFEVLDAMDFEDGHYLAMVRYLRNPKNFWTTWASW